MSARPDSDPIVSTAVPATPLRFYDAPAVALATLLGFTIAGGILMGINYRRLGAVGRGRAAFIAGLLIAAAFIALPSVLPAKFPSYLLVLPQALLAYGLSKGLQGEAVIQHIHKGGQFASRWKAAGVGLLSLMVLLGLKSVVVLGMPSAPRKHFDVGSGSQVQYSDPITDLQAKAVAEKLLQVGYFTEKTPATVVLSREGQESVVTFVVQPDAAGVPDFIAGFEKVGKMIAPAVGGPPIIVRLADKNRAPLKELPIK